MGPGLAGSGTVERLPSSERGCLREDFGERGLLRSGAVSQELLYLVDLGAKLVKLGEGAEAAVEVAGVVDLVAEDLDGLLVDGAGYGESGS